MRCVKNALFLLAAGLVTSGLFAQPLASSVDPKNKEELVEGYPVQLIVPPDDAKGNYYVGVKKPKDMRLVLAFVDAATNAVQKKNIPVTHEMIEDLRLKPVPMGTGKTVIASWYVSQKSDGVHLRPVYVQQQRAINQILSQSP